MIGIIITGHANFGSGLLSSLKLIAGSPDNVYAVDFLEGHSVEDLEKNINEKIDVLLTNGVKDVLILSDLLGGSPFKTSVEMKMKSKTNIEVISGTNLGMLIEVSMAKGFIEDINDLVNKAINTGKDQVYRYEYTEKVQEDVEEGI